LPEHDQMQHPTASQLHVLRHLPHLFACHELLAQCHAIFMSISLLRGQVRTLSVSCRWCHRTGADLDRDNGLLHSNAYGTRNKKVLANSRSHGMDCELHTSCPDACQSNRHPGENFSDLHTRSTSIKKHKSCMTIVI
jgi:hypothetical protein